uniref:DUF3718 domain-containing protein n=1 Tax=Ningiella ruwaisensis TaxID=2364274 RepID=UPI00109F3AA5|nr:DUF3718 domain-containing protein [Ningiella ruwaisensis]
MKKLHLSLAMILMSASFGSLALATPIQFEAADDSYESRLCVAVTKKGADYRVRQLVKQATSSRLITHNYREVVNNINCNGMNIVDFAREVDNHVLANKLDSFRDKRRAKSGKIIDIVAAN